MKKIFLILFLFVSVVSATQVTRIARGNAPATISNGVWTITPIDTVIFPDCTCSINDTIIILSSFEVPKNAYGFTVAYQLLSALNQAGADSLLGNAADTFIVQFETSQTGQDNDSSWSSLLTVTARDTLISLQAANVTLVPFVGTTSGSIAPFGNFLRGRGIIGRDRTASIPDTLRLSHRITLRFYEN